MSEELDIKKLRSFSTSRIINLFLDGKISKDVLKELIVKDDIFKLDRPNLEKVLRKQKSDKLIFPKGLRISADDISDAYGRILTGDDIYNLTRAGLVDEAFLLKMLKRSKVISMLEVQEKESNNPGVTQVTDKEKTGKKDKKDKKDEKAKNDKMPSREDEIPSDEDEKTGSEEGEIPGSEEGEIPGSEEGEMPVSEEGEKPVSEEGEIPVSEEGEKENGTAAGNGEPLENLIEEESDVSNHGIDDEGIQPNDSTSGLVLTNEKVREFFTATRLLRMFLEQKMSAEFVEDFKDVFKDEVKYRIEISKRIMEYLKKIFKDNIPVFSSIIMRLYFKGMILFDDLKRLLEDEIFKNSILKKYNICDILDENGRVIYTYTTKKDKAKEENSTGLNVEAEDEIPRPVLQRLLPLPGEIVEETVIEESPDDNVIIGVETDKETDKETDEMEDLMRGSRTYSTIAPLGIDELLNEYGRGNVAPYIMQTLSLEERCPITTVASFLLINKSQRTARVQEEFVKRNIYIEHIMELFFEYEGLTAEELKTIIKDLPQSVAIVNYINENTSFEQIRDLYKCKLISFRNLDLLKNQGFISLDEFEQIRRVVNKEEFYDSIASTTLYTRKEDISNDKTPVIEISDSERVLLTRILGISQEEIARISLINSKDNNGEPTSLDGYQIIGNRADGLIIFGKFDYKSPIFVMSYEEAAYFLRNKDNENYIVDDLIFVERLEGNEQVRVVEHDENMGKNIVQAVCDLSESAKKRYLNDEQYRKEVESLVKTLEERYTEERGHYTGSVTDEN